MLHRSVSRSFVTGVAAVLAAATLGAGPVTASPQQASAPVPEGFRAQSLTWTSPDRGWTLGAAPCEGGSEGDICTTVVRTRDGGRSWSAAGTVESPIAPPGEPGVLDLDFADARHGWAYGPSLERTRDGGRTWSPAPLPGDGRQVVALLAEAGRVYAVVSPCEIGQPPFECTDPPTLWWAPAASGRWRPTDVELPVGASAVLAASPGGRTVYVVGQMPPPTPDAFYATTDGQTWSPRPSPCDKEGNGDVLADVAPTSRRDVALLCVGASGSPRPPRPCSGPATALSPPRRPASRPSGASSRTWRPRATARWRSPRPRRAAGST